MPTRAIGSALGVSHDTVHKDLLVCQKSDRRGLEDSRAAEAGDVPMAASDRRRARRLLLALSRRRPPLADAGQQGHGASRGLDCLR